jgi:hypothetical protein
MWRKKKRHKDINFDPAEAREDSRLCNSKFTFHFSLTSEEGLRIKL